MDASFEAWVEKARAVPIEGELARRNIKLIGCGGKLKGPCPICGGDDRFAVNIGKPAFNCRGCGAGGHDAIGLVCFIDRVDFKTACETLTGEPPPAASGKASCQLSELKHVLTASFDYQDENGELLFQAVRFEFQNRDGSFVLADDGKRKKTFRQRRPDPHRPDRWLWHIDGARLVPYRLPELIEAVGNENLIVIAEGERKVDLLRGWNIAATCNSGGSQKWKADHSAFLRGANVVILPDNDPPGRKHLDAVAASLKAVDAAVRVLDLPGLPSKGDVVDWADAGGTAEQLHALIDRDARPWKPSNGEEDDTRPEAYDHPTIQIKLGELARLADETEAAILAANRGLYKRGGQIVRIGEIELLGADEKKTTALAIIEPNEHALLEDASASAHFVKYNKRESKWLPADPPMVVIKAWQARASLRLPLLSGVISTPLILPTGRIIDKPGYDEATGFYFNPLGADFPPIPKEPTRDDARAALDILKGLVEEFPFVDEASRAVALSGILTSVVRRALEFAFMHAVTAPSFGSGKSYLVDLFCMIATGRAAPVISQSKNAEEFEKRLDAHLLSGVAHMAIDNVSRPLGGDRLSQILTQAHLDVRPLGTSVKITLQPAIFVTATGTNLIIVEDLRRRTLLCSMDAKQERPELRKFSADPLKLVGESRGKYVAAALTIIRASMHAGGTRAEPINGYARYCAMVRDPLIWLGCTDPCATMETIREQDPTLGSKIQIARHWKEVFGNEPKTALQVILEASKRSFDNELIHRDFHEALSEIALDGRRLSSARLGYWLRKNKGDVFSLVEPDPISPDVKRSVAHWFTSGDKDRTRTVLWELQWS
jgi:putative DNA primase/helicase